MPTMNNQKLKSKSNAIFNSIKKYKINDNFKKI